MICKTYSYHLLGIEAVRIQIEIDVSNGLPGIDMVGSLAQEVRESKERVRIALKNTGVPVPPRKMTVNLSPADIKKAGTGFDLAIAVGILCGMEYVPDDLTKGRCFVGELGLDGSIREVRGILSIAYQAMLDGFTELFVPAACAEEAASVQGIRVYAVATLKEVLDALLGGAVCYKRTGQTLSEGKKELSEDFSDVQGQFLARRAAEIAAAGNHNLLLFGPPGSGKTMIASRMAGILPEMTFEEAVETTQIYSVAGKKEAGTGLLYERPMRSPHHTVSMSALIGGGQVPGPGEISLAHNGILFLDEFPEFDRRILETLRQPLEQKEILIARHRQTVRFPANFLFVAAMNPCPCGFYPDRNRCGCTDDQIRRYLGKLSQPLLDRIDLCVEVPRVKVQSLLEKKVQESSAVIRKRVAKARERQKERYATLGLRTNGELRGEQAETLLSVSEEARLFLLERYEKHQMSVRGYFRTLRVARTIADLEGSERIELGHVGEAMGYYGLPEQYRSAPGNGRSFDGKSI